MRFGHFDGQNREYVITRPDTPLPWINYLGESEYCALISQTAGGYSFYVDPREQRILRYRYDNVPFDQGGRYLFIRDDRSRKFFSPMWAPVYEKLDKYECRHGLGYTVISSEKDGIRTDITYFVPIGEDLEIWKVELKAIEPAAKRRGSKVGRSREVYSQGPTREITLFSYVEFCLWDAVGDSTNFQRTWSIGKARCVGSTIIHDSLYGSWKDIFAYFHCSEKIHSFDCQRKSFLGDFGYTPLQRPEAVVKGECGNSTAIGWSPIGAHCVKIKLKPGQKKTVIFLLGVSSKKEPATKRRGSFGGTEKFILGGPQKRFLNPKVVDQEIQKIKDYWKNNLSNFEVKTPDGDMDLSLNVWNQYQCRQTFAWSRYASYYESGIGRGMGFRDSNQDTLGFAHMIPEEVKRRILDLATMQFADGSTFHQYSPITKKGDLVGYSDDPLWLVYAAANYIKETGDFGILDEKVPFAVMQGMVQVGHYPNPMTPPIIFPLPRGGLPAGRQGCPEGTEGVRLYEHLRCGILRVWADRGKHGLPLSKFSDWNDCLNMLGKKYNAESVLVGFMLVAACNDMVDLLKAWGKEQKSKEFKNIAEGMNKVLNKVAWDGSWWKRAFNDKGRPVGSKGSKEGQIFLEPQPWSVISRSAGIKRGMLAMDSVHKHLFTKYGIKLLHPAYNTYHPELGEISTYPPGLKENASIFCHPNPWAIVAECMLKRGERAFDIYKAILPIAQNDRAEVRKTEPYVYCQMVAGPDHPDFGEGKNSWLTGSAAWNFYAASQYILGIRPVYNGLMIDPCIPSKWRNFTVSRTFRGSRYIIKIKNPKGGNNGVKFLMVDGRRIEGNIVPVFKDRKEHAVEAIIS